jgi:hypothetical protein
MTASLLTKRSASLAAFVGVLVSIVLVTAAPARGQAAPSSSSGTALGKVEQCVKQRKELLVLLLVDESASLKKTDPDAQRVVGSQVALQGLRRLAASSNADVALQVAGFANDFEPLTDWTALGKQSDAAIANAIEGFANRNEGLDTDYAHALQGAQQSLAARSAAATTDGGPAPCKLLLWFTDGEYSIDSRDEKEYAPDAAGDNRSQQIVDAGRALICRPNGLADGLHHDDVSVLALALSSPASPIAPGDLEFLQSVAAGTGGQQTCGTLGSATTGTSFTAGDLTDLLGLFDRLAAIGGTPDGPPQNQPICQRQSCPEGRRTFEIEDWMERFHLFAQTGLTGIVVQFEAPGAAQPVTIPSSGDGAVDVGTSVLRYSWINPKVLVVDGAPERGHENWAGQWAVTFIDPTGEHPNAVARSQIYLFGGLVPDVSSKATFRQGERNVLGVQLVDEKGVPVSIPSLPSTATLQARLTDPATGVPQNLEVVVPSRPSDRYQVVYETPADYQSSSARLDLALDLTTKSGLQLGSTSRQFDIPVKPPIEFPEVLPATLHFPSVSGTDSTKAQITLKANKANGCAWVIGSETKFADRPDAVEGVNVDSTPNATSEKSCVKVPAGSTRSIAVELQPSSAADGSVHGQITIGLSSEGETKTISKSIPASFDVTRPVDSSTRWALVVVLMVLGIGGPIAWLWIAARREARFQPTDRTRIAEVHVRVTRSTVTPVSEGSGGEVRLIDEIKDLKRFQPPTPERLRQFDVSSSPPVALRAVPPRSPFGLPRAEAHAEGLVSTSGQPRLLGLSNPNAAEISLALAGSWVFVATGAVERGDDGQATEVDGMLIAFFGPGDTVGQVGRTRAQVSERLPAAFGRLQRAFPPEAESKHEPVSSDGRRIVDDLSSRAGPPWGSPTMTNSAGDDPLPPFDSEPMRGARLDARAEDEAATPATDLSDPTIPPAEDEPPPWANS